MTFELKMPMEKLRQQKLFVATPMYGGQCAGMYCRSMIDLASLCSQQGIQLQVYYLFNESLITRARNYCVDEFMRSDATHLMFIDSDIGFDPRDVIALMAMAAQDESDYDVVGGAYPKKCIAWEKIKIAVDKGFADENPNELDKFVGDYVFNPKNNTGSIAIGEPAEVMEIGTGFMLIRKNTFHKLKEKMPHLSYKPDHVRTAAFDGTREIMAYFDCIIDPTSKRYLSEDYKFCHDVWAAGLKVWLCPWMKLSHVGTFVFGGSLSDLAAVGASATADETSMERHRKKKKT